MPIKLKATVALPDRLRQEMTLPFGTMVQVKNLANAAAFFGAAVLLALGCSGRPPVAVPPDALPVKLTLDHLRHLGFDVSVAGRPVRAVALYAEAPDYRPIGSPARDGFEGLAAVDDAARAAVVFLRDFEHTADQRSKQDALALLSFVTAMEQGDGELVNFIHADGAPNRTAPTSRKSFSYWAARALWAMGEAIQFYNLPLKIKKTQIERIMTQSAAAFNHAVTARQYIELYEKMLARPLIKTDV